MSSSCDDKYIFHNTRDIPLCIQLYKAIHKLRTSNFSNLYFTLRQTQNALLKGKSYIFIQPALSQIFYGNIAKVLHLPEEDNYLGVSKDVLEYLAK
jgi:hypothetical protein